MKNDNQDEPMSDAQTKSFREAHIAAARARALTATRNLTMAITANQPLSGYRERLSKTLDELIELTKNDPPTPRLPPFPPEAA